MQYHLIIKGSELLIHTPNGWISNALCKEKDYILYDSTYMTFWKSQTYKNKKRISSCLGWEESWLQKGSLRDSFEMMQLFYLFVRVGTWLYAFVKTYRTIHREEQTLAYINFYKYKSKNSKVLNPSMAPHHWQGNAPFALDQRSRAFLLWSFPPLSSSPSLISDRSVSELIVSHFSTICGPPHGGPPPLRAFPSLCTPEVPIRLNSLQFTKMWGYLCSAWNVLLPSPSFIPAW